MGFTDCPASPSSILPALRGLQELTEEQTFSALHQLTEIYCPLLFSTFDLRHAPSKTSGSQSVLVADSGYASETEEDGGNDKARGKLTALRADVFERNFAERWLTSFIARGEELLCNVAEDVRESALELAYALLESFYNTERDAQDGTEQEFSRLFNFEFSPSDPLKEKVVIEVQLNDGLAGTDSNNPDDVGLQSWGASIIFSKLMCDSPSRFGLTQAGGSSAKRIIELGAGTGLVSLVLGNLLPHLGMETSTLIATDYHPAVLANLRSNIANNFPHKPEPVQSAFLDWSSPGLDAQFTEPADVLIATDAVYGFEHAVWIRDCASRLLAPEGVFWLLLTVRRNGKFEVISRSVEEAFVEESARKTSHGQSLRILKTETIGKQRGIGRADESEYRLFRIGWASA